jgi:hypothetical protein
MKILIRHTLGILTFVGAAFTVTAQTNLAPDQNPNYQVSRDRYMKVADSINSWHSTTVQQTYKAIDYLEDKRIAKEQRRAFRQELRLERARNNRHYGYYNYRPYRQSRYSYYPRYNAWSILPWWGL